MEPAPLHLERIAALLAATPPRQVSPEVRRAAMRQTAPLLFIFVGAGVTAFAMMFVVAFFPWNLTRQWKLDAGDTATTPGKIVAIEPTGVSISKSRVMRSTFEYSPPAGGVFRGTCYTTRSPWSTGDGVVVRYRPDDPSIACVEGGRLTKTGGVAAFVLILPSIGLTLVGVGVRLRHQAMRILVHGEVTEAYVTALERTETRIGNDHVYEIMLKRIDRPNNAQIKMSKWDPAVVALARRRLESKQPLFVLFDPKRPDRGLLPEVM